MTFLGAGFIVGGRLLWISGLKDKKVFADENDTHPRAFGKVVLGLAGMALGVVSVGGGITMWAIGGSKVKKYNKNVSINTTENGVGLVYKF
ncbi:MAG TPA: hypothetical protein PK110_07690 [Niabella sp.]|nr:hypothetical protein [Chitinophagaceae bacterium]HRN47030.1 hypothetical protein [Niabella sp.]HRO84688.1 hypothetical protein [Niabella sp.]HUN04033.1 hypothetical protein [Niabella sp.]